MMNMEKINNEALENVIGGMAPLPFPRKKDPLFPSMLFHIPFFAKSIRYTWCICTAPFL